MIKFASCYAEELLQYYTLRSQVLSESARMHERCYLKRFDEYLTLHLSDDKSLSESFINEWIGTIKGKSSSVENQVIVIRQFLKYLILAGYTIYIPVIPKVHEDYLPYIFSDDELDCIFASADNIVLTHNQSNLYVVLEFPVILRLLYSCGLRIGETLRLKIMDIDFENGILRMTHTKGDKQRLVPMNPDMTEIIRKYSMAMGLIGKPESWLFPSLDDENPISDHTIKNRFKRILKDNNISLKGRKKHERGPCLHCMRHVFAFKSFAQTEKAGRTLNDNVPYLSIYLGHDSLEETSKYLKFSSELYPDTLDIFGEFMEGLLPEVDYEA